MLKLYNRIPLPLRNSIQRHFGKFSPKPFVLKDEVLANNKFPHGFRGGAIFTADFELGWAVRYSKKTVDPLIFATRERENVPIILDCCEKHDIPVTWATVGHLFLSECKRGDHDWMHRLPYFDDHWKYNEGDWFDCDPCTSVDKDPSWYAPDLVEKIVASKVQHEISCHSFSHIDCSEAHCPPQVIDDELTACETAAARWGISFSSMAFPGGTAGNFLILKKHGIKIYRRRVGRFEVGYPFRDEVGLLVSPTGPAIAKVRQGWTAEDEFVRFKKAIDKAIKHRSLVHIWFHPSADQSAFAELMPLIFSYCAGKRESGQLWTGTMNGIQEHINGEGLL